MYVCKTEVDDRPLLNTTHSSKRSLRVVAIVQRGVDSFHLRSSAHRGSLANTWYSYVRPDTPSEVNDVAQSEVYDATSSTLWDAIQTEQRGHHKTQIGVFDSHNLGRSRVIGHCLFRENASTKPV